MNYYNFAYLERFKGVDYVYSISENSESFEAADDVTEDAWQAEVAKFEAIMSEWRGLLDAADESKFDEKISATNKASWAELISNVNLHNAHHGGQIVLIRKLQGSWDASKGVS